ncbi:hypothetical protein scyTo_0005660 [Scyliorhinus torazame]|uniref:Protein kinase domain-containing protein n=1 Tax=Scyliorhinus torazame TaxID=75743 RepID=A0A401PB76_SCYTO|nr:hypothetical protein [Scyliorhinus torazame]
MRTLLLTRYFKISNRRTKSQLELQKQALGMANIFSDELEPLLLSFNSPHLKGPLTLQSMGIHNGPPYALVPYYPDAANLKASAWMNASLYCCRGHSKKSYNTRLTSNSIVHLCLRKVDQKLVILKQIPVEQMTKDERLAAQNECQVLKLLNHPNIIEYYENFLEDKALMIAMEYAPAFPGFWKSPGGTLAEYIQKRNSLLDEETILHFFVQILLALHHVHNKLILHRDLKTQNILLDKYQMIVKIGDFGISKILSSKSKAYTVRLLFWNTSTLSSIISGNDIAPLT